jgi:hypothetical protein
MALTEDHDPTNIGLQRWRRLWYCTLAATLVIGVATVFAVYAFGHHRSVRALIIALVAMLAWLGIATAVGWRRLNRNHEMHRLMEHDWRTRWRVGKALRKGRPIPEEDQAAARSIIDVQKRQRKLPWLYVALAAIWLLNTIVAHGNLRWIDLGLALLYLAIIPLWLRTRKKILKREPDVGVLDGK